MYIDGLVHWQDCGIYVRSYFFIARIWISSISCSKSWYSLIEIFYHVPKRWARVHKDNVDTVNFRHWQCFGEPYLYAVPPWFASRDRVGSPSCIPEWQKNCVCGVCMLLLTTRCVLPTLVMHALEMLPWWSLLEPLSWYTIILPSHCNSFEDRVPVDEINGYPRFSNELQWLDDVVPGY